MSYKTFCEVGPVREEIDAKLEEKIYSYYTIQGVVQNLIGKTLTFLEATIQDKEQLKAQKDIIRQFFGQEMQSWYDSTIEHSMKSNSTN